MSKVFLGLTHHNHGEYTDLAIRTALENTESQVKIMVLDDGSELPYVNKDATVFRHDKPEGCIESWNGIYRTWYPMRDNWPYLVISNNDVLFSEGWDRGLIECFYRHEDCGISGPMTNQPGNRRSQLVPGGRDMQDFRKFTDYAQKRSMEAPEPVRVPYVNGFCFMMNRERLLGARGPFLGEISPSTGRRHRHLGGETLYQQAMYQRGYAAYIAKDSFVFHFRSVSIQVPRLDFSRYPRPRLEKT